MVQLVAAATPVISRFMKIQNGLPFWYHYARVILEKRASDECRCCC